MLISSPFTNRKPVIEEITIVLLLDTVAVKSVVLLIKGPPLFVETEMVSEPEV